MQCESTTFSGGQCGRSAYVIVNDKPCCWQHERQQKTPNNIGAFIEADERGIETIRGACPFTGKLSPSSNLIFSTPLGNIYSACAVCGRPYRMRKCFRMIYTDPLSYQRSFVNLCRRKRCSRAVREWEASAQTRRLRAQYDWERQNPELASLKLTAGMPPQYPSVSRATLRAFLESGMDTATVGGSSVSAINGTIKSLGFSSLVFAEVRSGQTVIRRVPE